MLWDRILDGKEEMEIMLPGRALRGCRCSGWGEADRAIFLFGWRLGQFWSGLDFFLFPGEAFNGAG